MNEPEVLCDVDARGVATVSLNRPAVNNAYDEALLAALLATVGELAVESTVRVLVVRGNGPHFQAGADLTWLRAVAARDSAANLAASRLTAEAMRALNQLPKPTVALIHGACVGGGTGLASSCDVVIAERSASFAISEARWGMAATIIFPQLVAAIGIRNVRRYALTCERFDAETARAIGLVHQVCEPGGLDAAAARVLDDLLCVAPDAIALSKRSAMQVAGALVNDAVFERLVAEHAAKRQSVEAADGLASFAEKRPAAWNPGR